MGGELDASALLREAERIAPSIGPTSGEPAWVALPMRPEVAPCSEERSAAIARVLTWARAGGVVWSGIEIVVAADGTASVRACRDIAPGEPILTLPRRLMIVDNEVTADALRPRDALAAWLPLELREPASPWRAYLDALPVQLAELPMFHRDLDALAGTAAYALAAEENREVLGAYAGLSPELRARVSLADFAWGCAIVKSRGFHAPGFVEHRLALLPVVEFFNHRLGDTTWSYDPRDGMFVITTERAFAIGDEVHFTYGDRSNTLLMVHFGFAVAGNPTREAGLVFERATDPVNAAAAHLLWNLSLDAPARVRVGCVLDHRFVRALSLARLQASGPTERTRAVEAGLGPAGEMPWLGGAIEEAAFGLIAAAAEGALAALRASEEARLVRDAEREVLEEIIEVASAAREYVHWDDPVRLRAAVAADARGARRLLRQYLHALADELEG